MPDVTNALLQTVDQTNGGNNNTWGDIVDANFLKLENAIAGSNTNTSTSGTVALTADQQRNAMLKFTGALSGNLIIEVAATSKLWMVDNETSGSFTLTMRVTGGGGASYVVPRGMPHLVFCDGTNVYAATGSRSRAMTGLTLAASGGSAQFTIATGECTADASPYAWMTLSSSLIKTTSAWASGTGNGSLDTGAISNSTWYYAYLIGKLDGTTDVITTLSSTSPLMPSGYVNYRRLGAMKTDGSAQWVKFKQVGNEFLWDTSVTDQNAINVNGTSQLLTLTVPPITGVKALYRANATNTTTSSLMLFTSPDESDQTPGAGVGKLSMAIASTTDRAAGEFSTRTVSGQIRAVASAGPCTTSISTYGWVDTLLRAGG